MNAKVIRLCVVIVSCALMVWAQGTGKISGKVQDVSGSPVAGATVTLSDLTSGAVVRVKTAADGQFGAKDLAPDR